jgi:3-dehydroquinate synthase
VSTPVLTIRHATGTCPVHIQAGLLETLPDLARAFLPGRRLVVIADHQVAAVVPTRLDAPVLTFPAGERSKSRETWARLTDELLTLGLGRDGALVALGGGVTGDLAGFVAATFLRGIPYLQVPTSLLAMLDASIGGKTGLDVPAGKNLVGAFHQPAAVLMDLRVLRTLPDAELRTGLAEAVKHAVIADAEHFAWLRSRTSRLLARDEATLEMLLLRSVAIKAEVVAADERETGRRAVLNAGHTVAHALEAATNFGLRHGEAVAIGLVLEARLGEQLGHTAAGTSAAIADLLTQCGLPVTMPRGVSRADVVAAMATDKKNRSGVLHFSLPARIGAITAPWTVPVTAQAVAAIL